MTGSNRISPVDSINSPQGAFSAIVVFFVALCFSVVVVWAAETKPPSEADTALTHQVVQSYEQIQEQQRSVLRALDQARQDTAATARAIEIARQEAEAASKHNSAAVEDRLGRIEQAITTQHDRELDNVQKSHRFTLIMLGVFAGVGFFGILFLAVFLLRVMNRRTETMISQFTGQPLAPGFTRPALGSGDLPIAPSNRVEHSSTRFIHTIERLEKRINELEGVTEPAPAGAELPQEKAPRHGGVVAETRVESPESKIAGEPETAVARAKTERGERDARIALLIGKGQAQLNLQQIDSALACFNEVIALDSTNAPAFVNKGAALERLGHLDEAIDCYDRAIALDDSMTMAYLSKGGVFNRLERYGEALQCYEQALRAQQKPGVAQVQTT